MKFPHQQPIEGQCLYRYTYNFFFCGIEFRTLTICKTYFTFEINEINSCLRQDGHGNLSESEFSAIFFVLLKVSKFQDGGHFQIFIVNFSKYGKRGWFQSQQNIKQLT